MATASPEGEALAALPDAVLDADPLEEPLAVVVEAELVEAVELLEADREADPEAAVPDVAVDEPPAD